MGCIRSLIIDSVTQNKVQFDLQGFLQNVVLADLNESGERRPTSKTYDYKSNIFWEILTIKPIKYLFW